MAQVVGEEFYGTPDRGLYRQLIRRSDGKVVVLDHSKRFTTITGFFMSVFLPHGYPESVSSDYLQYQMWDTIQAFASSITGSLAAERTLTGLGVGKKDASVLGATLTWLIKHGAGMVGQILFAWLQGTALDCDAKRFRFFADVLNDVAIFLEILAPAFGDYFILVVCIASVAKSIVGVAGGATRASLTQHQARRNNLADVAAKDGSQETLVNLAALVCSLIILPVVSGKIALTWFIYAILTTVHLYANYRAVSCVVMEELNKSRFHILASTYLSTGQSLSLSQTNNQEPIIFRVRKETTVFCGVPLSKILTSGSYIEIVKSTYQSENYILNIEPRKKMIYVAYNEKAKAWDMLKSLFQAEVIEFAREDISPDLSRLYRLKCSGDKQLIPVSKKITDEIFPLFMGAISECGWLTDRALLDVDEWRAWWTL